MDNANVDQDLVEELAINAKPIFGVIRMSSANVMNSFEFLIK
jgi:hypothetical protein